MKKKINSTLFLAILLVFLAFCLTGCGLWSTPLKSISFGEITTVEMNVGEELQLQPIFTPSTASSSVRYTTSNAAVASVSESGLLRGESSGTATVTASNVLGTISCELSVVVTYETIPEGLLQLAAENAQQLYGTSIEPVSFTLSWGDIHVPTTATIEWYRKLKDDAEFTKIADATSQMSYILTPPNEMGYSATMQVRVTYDENTYISNDIIYGVYDEMRDVQISYSQSDSGLEVESATYYAQLGEEFTLSLDWNDDSNQDPEIRWFIEKGSVGTKAEIAGQSLATLSYAIVPTGSSTASDMIDDYTVTASADGVFNNMVYNFYLSTDYADVKNATLSAAGHTGSNISMTTLDSEDLVFSAGWNYNCTDNTKVVIEYYTAPPLENEETEYTYTLQHTVNASATDRTYTYSPILENGVYAVKTIVYNESGSPIKSEAVVEVTILEQYNAVQTLSLSLSSGILEQKNGIYGNLVFSASPTPSECLNSTLEYEWFVDGILQSEQSDSTFTLASSYLSSNLGETVVKAKLAGVESKQMTALAFVNSTSSDSYLNDKFVWNANEYNHYISSMDEFVIAMSYIAMTRISAQNFCFDSNSGITFNDTDSFRPYLLEGSAGFDEAGTRSYSYGYTGSNTVQIGWDSGAPLTSSTSFDETSPYYNAEADRTVTQLAGMNAHYSTLTDRATLPVDGFANTYNVTTSNMLSRVVSWGYKPTFDAVGSETAAQTTARTNAQTIYNNARAILLEICDDQMTDVEKVHSIYDWIIEEVQYDYALAGATGATVDQTLEYDGFYLEGVFLKGAEETRTAVCDGKSKAFALLCGMEGIQSCRIIGYVNNDEGAGHAWNKVLVDADGNGIKNWYIVDSTWGDLYMSGKEYLRHNYFLLGEDEIYYSEEFTSNTHTESRDYYPEAEDSVFEYYQYLSYTVNADLLDGQDLVGIPSDISNTATAIVENAEDLAVLLAVAQTSGYTEFKMADGVSFSETLFSQAKRMLVNEGGGWSTTPVERGCYLYVFTP